jgi:glycosyltransferase involved in cell wall biosynthesis
VVVAPEIYESYSYTVAQAMACAKAVIATSVGGIQETLNYGKAGLLYEPGVYNKLADHMKNLVTHPEQIDELGEKAYQFINQDSSFETLRPQYLELYKSI